MEALILHLSQPLAEAILGILFVLGYRRKKEIFFPSAMPLPL